MKITLTRTVALVGLLLVLAGFQLAAAQIVISEVDPATGTIELHNIGMAAADASGFVLCNRPSYEAIGNLEVVSGEMMIPADSLLVVVWDAVAAADAELGIYVDNQFGNAESLISYIQWGSAGHGRESVAAAAGLWTTGTFLPTPAADQTIAMTGMDMDADPIDNWGLGVPTLGELADTDGM